MYVSICIHVCPLVIVSSATIQQRRDFFATRVRECCDSSRQSDFFGICVCISQTRSCDCLNYNRVVK